MKSWKEYVSNVANYNLSSKVNSSIADWAELGFKIKALEENKTIHSTNLYGTIENSQSKDFISFLQKLENDFHLVESSRNFKSSNKLELNKDEYGMDFETGKSNFAKIFTSEDTFVGIHSTTKNDFRIEMSSFEESKLLELAEKFNFFLKKKKDRTGRVCTLLMDNNSLYVSDLGPAGIPLVRENYAEDILKGYDFLVKDLPAENPRGRLAILDGEPGTGKSYLIKSLINDISNVIFLIVPSSLVSRISDPSFMPAIINLHEEEGVPIIMLLEDADNTLLPRQTDNMSVISDLLNFADGIVGNIVDFRIVATTNAKKINIEPALMRKGRLSKHIHVGKLEYEQACSIFERLTKKALSEEDKKSLQKKTLAEVYDLAYDFLYEKENKENK